MGQAIFWSNVGIDVQTGLGAAITLVSISKAATGVAKYSGAVDPNVGDIILMAAQGMYQVDKRLFRIANVNPAAKTFELENEDTSTYDSLVAGSFQVVTTIHDNVRKRVPTIVSPLSFGMDNIFDLADPGFVECNKAYKAKSMRAVRLRFGTGAKMLLLGYVAAAGVSTGQAQGVVQTKVSIEAQNMPTVYPN